MAKTLDIDVTEYQANNCSRLTGKVTADKGLDTETVRTFDVPSDPYYEYTALDLIVKAMKLKKWDHKHSPAKYCKDNGIIYNTSKHNG